MRKFAVYAVSVALTAVLITGILFTLIVTVPGGAFSHTYQSVIQDKYETLMSTDSPKLIIVAGSSAAYGIDEELLCKELGMPVVNLGLYGGLGNLFQTQLVTANLKEGDIVVLAYEYNWPDSDSFRDIICDTVMSGIDEKISMYRLIPARCMGQVIGYLPTYAGKKLEYIKNPGEDVHHELFNEKGELIQERAECILGEYGRGSKEYNPLNLRNCEISKESISYLVNFRKYCENKGARVVFTAPPFLKEALECSENDLRALAENEEEKIGIPYISDPADYIYDREYMYDTVYHCNDSGAEKRTLQLSKDLKAYLEP